MRPYTIQLDPHTKGDTWQGIPSIGPILFNGIQPTSQLDRIRMQIRSAGPTGTLVLTFDSETGDEDYEITITDATTWEAEIAEIPEDEFDLAAGPYYWSMRFWDKDGVARTLYDGGFEVLESATTNAVPAP